MEQSVMQNATQTIKINFSRKMYDFFNAKCGKSYVMQNELICILLRPTMYQLAQNVTLTQNGTKCYAKCNTNYKD